MINRARSSGLIRYIFLGISAFMIGYIFYYLTYFNYGDILIGFYNETTVGTIFGAVTIGLTFGTFKGSIGRGIKLGIAGLLGFLIGTILALVMVRIFPLFIIFPIFSFFIGLIGGAFYGIILWKVKKVFIMAIAGGLGVFIGTIFGLILLPNTFLSYMSYGIIVGAFLGAGMYFAEKEDDG